MLRIKKKSNTRPVLVIICCVWLLAAVAFAWFVMPDEEDLIDIEQSKEVEMVLEIHN